MSEQDVILSPEEMDAAIDLVDECWSKLSQAMGPHVAACAIMMAWTQLCVVMGFDPWQKLEEYSTNMKALGRNPDGTPMVDREPS